MSAEASCPRPLSVLLTVLALVILATFYHFPRRASTLSALSALSSISAPSAPATPDAAGGGRGAAGVEEGGGRVPYVTLLFNQTEAQPLVDHNCALLSRAGYGFTIFTDDLSQPACTVCSCVLYAPVQCDCPHPTLGQCELCKKLQFVVDVISNHTEFIFIDADFLILRPVFMPALQARTLHFDFLASYGFHPPANMHFTSSFNSGLFFMRRLPALDYGQMIPMLSRLGSNNDQNIISAFVRKHYARWDTLSLRFHCRFLDRPENNIGVHACLAFHSKKLSRAAYLAKANYTLLRTDGL